MSHMSKTTDEAVHSRMLRRPPGCRVYEVVAAASVGGGSAGTSSARARALATTTAEEVNSAMRQSTATATAVTTTGEPRLRSSRVEDCTTPKSRPRRRAGAAANDSAVTAGAAVPASKPPRPRKTTKAIQLVTAAEAAPNRATPAAAARIRCRLPQRLEAQRASTMEP